MKFSQLAKGCVMNGSFDIRQLETMASIIYNCWLFFVGGCKPGMEMYCKVNGRQMKAREMFARASNYLFVKPDSLPLDPHIKAVGISPHRFEDQGRLYIETTIVDWEKVALKLEEARATNEGLELRGRTFFWYGEKIAGSNSRTWFKDRSDPRTTVFSEGFRNVPIQPLMLIADLLWGFNCFKEEAMRTLNSAIGIDLGSGYAEGRQRQLMAQRMEQRQMQLIVQQQVPMLTMSLRQLARISQFAEILQMSGPQLRSHINRQSEINPVLEIR